MEAVNASVNETWTRVPAWYEHVETSELDHIMHMCIQLTISVLTIVGNSFVFLAFALFPEVRDENNNLFILGLAVTDMLSGLLSIPINVIKKFLIPLFWRNIAVDILTSHQYCITSNFLQIFPSVCSYAMVTIIAIDRFVFIRWPLRYMTIMTRTVCKRLIVSAFVFEAVVSGGALILSAKEKFDPDHDLCTVEVLMANNVVRTVALSLSSFIPIGASFLLHTYIAFTAHRQRKKIHAELGIEDNQARVKQLRITKIMTKIVGIFAICVMPTLISKVVPARLHSTEPWVISLKHFMAEGLYLNSAINPLIYAFSVKQFTVAFVKLSRCMR